MPKVRDRVTRQHLPAGLDGEALVLDSRNPTGLRWQPGIDRLITDLTPELSGDLDANDHSITGLDTLTFTDTAGTIAGVQNQNLLDKSAGVYGVTGLVTGASSSTHDFAATAGWHNCPVGGGATHTLAAGSSAVFTMPADQSVLRYKALSGTAPSIIAEIHTSGSVVRTTGGTTVSVMMFAFAKKNGAVPEQPVVASREAASTQFVSVVEGLYYPFSFSWITQLDDDDYIGPMFLSLFYGATFNLALTQTRIRSIREV